MLAGIDETLDGEPLGRVHLRVIIGGASLETFAAELRLHGKGFGGGEKAMAGQSAVECQRVIETHASAKPRAVKQAAMVKGHEEPERLHQVRRDAQQGFPFAQVHAHQAQVEHLEVA